MEKEKLTEEWKYEFEYWRQTFASDAIELISSEDRSESYEMDRRHLFKLENGNYAVVIERGCSCYSTIDANINIYKDFNEAKLHYDDWCN